MKFGKIIAGVLCVALGLSLCGCGNKTGGDTSADSSVSSSSSSTSSIPTPSAPVVMSAYKSVTLNSDGTLEVSRKEIGNTPMGEDGTWTVFVYMSGSSLESVSGKATEDINEMLAASTGENVRFVVQTGGSYNWRNDYTDSEMLCRYEISDGKLTELEAQPLASMAEASTFRDFLKWGVENYPAAKMGVVFWGHGKGSLVGVCKDDVFRDAYLPLSGIQTALDEVSASMSDKFEFVGFDACYMGSVEAADMLATYARYMIGSEEYEPMNGWDYTVLGDLLGREPNAGWDVIAKTLCDGFIDGLAESIYANRITISVIDLSKIDAVSERLNDLAGDLCDALTDRESLRGFETRLEGAEHFSQENAFEGYANAADLGDVARAGGLFSDKADRLLEAIEGATVYKRNAVEHKNACGLTVSYPFEPGGLLETRVFDELSVCPYYAALADIVMRSSSPAADLSGYDKNVIAELWCDSKNNGSDGLRNYRSNVLELPTNHDKNGISPLVRLTGDLSVDSDGAYSVIIDPDTLQYIAGVGINVYSSQPKNSYRCLGTKIAANADWETGVFSDSFDGNWYLLPNGEPLQIKLREDSYDRGGITYDAQVILSGSENALTFTHAADNSLSINGFWRSGADGVLSYEPPAVGDSITALYDIYTRHNDKFSSEEGTEHIFADEPAVHYGMLPDGNYYCIAVVTDILGERVYSENMYFTVADGQLSPMTSDIE